MAEQLILLNVILKNAVQESTEVRFLFQPGAPVLLQQFLNVKLSNVQRLTQEEEFVVVSMKEPLLL